LINERGCFYGFPSSRLKKIKTKIKRSWMLLTVKWPKPVQKFHKVKRLRDRKYPKQKVFSEKSKA